MAKMVFLCKVINLCLRNGQIAETSQLLTLPLQEGNLLLAPVPSSIRVWLQGVRAYIYRDFLTSEWPNLSLISSTKDLISLTSERPINTLNSSTKILNGICIIVKMKRQLAAKLRKTRTRWCGRPTPCIWLRPVLPLIRRLVMRLCARFRFVRRCL
jgi:hypothetical protein